MSLIRGREVFSHLAAVVDEAEESRSSFWDYEVGNFKVDVNGEIQGETVLGTVSAKTDIFRTLAHKLLQSPFRWLSGGTPELGFIESHARTIAQRQGRQYTFDMMRQALTVAFARKAIVRDQKGSCNLVIGDGYGVLTALLLLDDPTVPTICVNLTKSLLIDLAQIKKAFPEVEPFLVTNEAEFSEALVQPNTRLIAVRADDAGILKSTPIHAAFNVVSMQEMELDVVASYFDILRENPAAQTVFYCCNKLWKQLPDGTEVKFHDYPWRDSDAIVSEGPCHWSQWIYNARPPFWHYRKGEKRIIWHRLAILDKTIGLANE